MSVSPPERAPAEFDGAEAPRDGVPQALGQGFGLVEQQRAVRFDSFAVSSAEQPRDGLTADFAEQIPERDVDARDDVFQRAAASLPEGTLPQLFADAFRFGGRLAQPEGPERFYAGLHEIGVGEDAACAGEPLVGEHLDEGVKVIFRRVPAGPTAVDGGADEPVYGNLANLHGTRLVAQAAANNQRSSSRRDDREPRPPRFDVCSVEANGRLGTCAGRRLRGPFRSLRGHRVCIPSRSWCGGFRHRLPSTLSERLRPGQRQSGAERGDSTFRHRLGSCRTVC